MFRHLAGSVGLSALDFGLGTDLGGCGLEAWVWLTSWVWRLLGILFLALPLLKERKEKGLMF